MKSFKKFLIFDGDLKKVSSMKNWKKIKDFENYLISDEGEIINSRGLILKPYKTIEDI